MTDRPSQPEAFGGPYVGIAVFCEKILREADGVMSLIRIVDRITFQVPTPGTAPAAYPLVAVIMLKAGDAHGTYSIVLQTTGPSGQTLGTIEAPALFEGNDRGVAVALQFAFQPAEEGLHWFDVMVEGQRLTRIPLRAIYQRLSVTGAGQGPAA